MCNSVLPRLALALAITGLCLGATGCKTTSSTPQNPPIWPTSQQSSAPRKTTWQWPWRRTTPVEQPPPLDGPELPPLTPGTNVEWGIDSSAGQPHPGQHYPGLPNQHYPGIPNQPYPGGPGQPPPGMSGHGTIAPDGTLMMGPYGQFRVSGMSPAQAQASLEHHLQPYVSNPRVRLQPAGTAAGTVGYTSSDRTWSSSDEVQEQAPVTYGASPSGTVLTPRPNWNTYTAPNWDHSAQPAEATTGYPSRPAATPAPQPERRWRTGPVLNWMMGRS